VGWTHRSVCGCCGVSRVGWRKIHILCFVAFNETCCKISWSKQQVGALRPFRAMWRPCPHRCAGATHSHVQPEAPTLPCCAPNFAPACVVRFFFAVLFYQTVPQQCPCMAPHGSNMAPTVHNITIWFEQILACRFPHSHLAQVSNVSLEIRVFRSCLVRKLGWRDIFLLIIFAAFYSNFVSARSAQRVGTSLSSGQVLAGRVKI
jgi:hypothetical protein